MIDPTDLRGPRRMWLALARLVVDRPRATVALVGGVALVAGLLAALNLRVRPGYVDLLDRSSALQARYLDLLDEVGNVEALHVVVSAADADEASRFVDAYSVRLADLRDQEGAPLVTAVMSGVDREWLAGHALAWASPEVIDLLAAAPETRAVLAGRADAASVLEGLASMLERAPETMAASTSAQADPVERERAFAAVTSLVRELDRAASGAPASLSRWLASLGEGRNLDAAGHAKLGDGRLVVTVTPADLSNDYTVMKQLLDGASAAGAAAMEETGATTVQLAFTGSPALIVDEMSAVRRDVALASALSFLLVTALFFVSFQSLRHVVLAALANAAGLAMTFGAAWLLVGYLNLFSSVFAAVLAGLGIDFGIHLIHRYESLRRQGSSVRDALLLTIPSVGPPIALSALTTAAAFLTVMTSEFDGFAQLGLISGVGVVLCLATAFTLIPALLSLTGRRADTRERKDARPPWSSKLLAWPVRHARLAGTGGAVLLGLALWGAMELRFDHDLMNLQPSGTEAVALQRDESLRIATHRAFAWADTLDEARTLEAAFASLPSVASVSSAASLLPVPASETAAARREALGRLHVAVSTEGVAEALTPPPALEAATRRLDVALAGLADLAFEAGDADVVAAIDGARASLATFSDGAAKPAAMTGLQAFSAATAADASVLRASLPDLAARDLGPADLPAGLASSLVGRSGKLAVVVEPRTTVWDRARLEEFVAELRSIDPLVSGPPVQILEITELMRVSLIRAAWLAFALIVVMSAIGMRSVLGTALALFPLVTGFVLMLGAMRLCGVPLNPANLVALPLLLGIGVDAGIHLAHRWHDVRDASRAVGDVGHALLITSLTTVAGFLPLLLAKHRGIASLGAATCLGSLGMLVSACVLMPALLALLDARRARRHA